jgi:hypothetical protein
MTGADAATLWARLKQAGLVAGEAPVASGSVTPWYVRAMLGIAGWIGALFLLGFVGAGFAFVMKSAFAALFVGALMCAGATVLYRARASGDFANQFAFAVSLAGQALIVIGVGKVLGTGWGWSHIALPFALLALVLFVLIPNFLHRVWSAMSGVGALVVAFDSWGLQPYTHALVFAAFSWAWINEFRVRGRS